MGVPAGTAGPEGPALGGGSARLSAMSDFCSARSAFWSGDASSLWFFKIISSSSITK